MSTATRDAVTRRLTFSHGVAQNDLQEMVGGRYKAHTHLVAMLNELSQLYPGGVLVTALVDDHHDDSHLGVHGHTGGYSVDCYPADWNESGGRYEVQKVEKFLRVVAVNPWVHKAGLAGIPARFINGPFWPSRIIVFEDGGADHVHLQAHEDVRP